MPFKSKAQQRFMFANKKKLESSGVDVKEWADSTDFKKLPEKVSAVTDTHQPGESKFKALPHQERVADKLEDAPADQGLLAAHDVGTGKTFTAINASKRLKLPILAITPASLRTNFQKELDATGTRGSTVMSYGEALNRINNPAFSALARRSLVVFDEAHNMGQEASQRSQLSSRIPGKKLLLTGTPVRNAPHEIAPLINGASPGSLPNNEKDFNDKFIATKEIPVGFWGRLRGVKPGIVHVPTNLDNFAAAIRGKVDVHSNVDRSNFPSFSESIIQVPMSAKQQATYEFAIGKYPALAYKVKHGIPPSKTEGKSMTAFLSGPRQISNHPGGFNASASDADAPKFKAAADEIEKRVKSDKNFRGVVYSNFLEAGVDPMQRELETRSIPSSRYNGDMSDNEKKEAVRAYNAGEVPVMVISSAGAEGLDLKGTKLMQILEPHWNEEKINQVRGRAIRYKSHAHLPEEERHVEVQRFHSVPSHGFLGRLTAKSPHGKGIDDYIYNMALEKRELNQPFLDMLRREGGEGPEKSGSAADVEAFLAVDFILDAEVNDMPTFPTLSHTQSKISAALPIMAQLYPNDPARRYDYSHEISEAADMKDKARRDAEHKAHEAEEKAKQKAIDDAIKEEQRAVDKERDRLIKAEEKAKDRAADQAIKAQEREEERIIEKQIRQEERQEEAAVRAEERQEKILETQYDTAQAEVQRATEAANQAEDNLHRLECGVEAAPAAAPAEAEPAAVPKEAEWTSPANLAVHAQKHGDEFGGQSQYIEAENQLSASPPEDLAVLNKRCQDPASTSIPRCSTAYHSPSLGIVLVKDNTSGKTISLYKRGRPIFPALKTRESFDPISGAVEG